MGICRGEGRAFEVLGLRGITFGILRGIGLLGWACLFGRKGWWKEQVCSGVGDSGKLGVC